MKKNFLINENQIESLVNCGSASEFLLKLSIFGNDFIFSSDYFYEMISMLPDKPVFMPVLAELISNYSVFDHIILETEYGLDYCIARYFQKIDDKKYKKFSIILYFSENSPSWGWRNSNYYSDVQKIKFDSDYKNLLQSIAEKIEAKEGSDIPNLINFKKIYNIA